MAGGFHPPGLLLAAMFCLGLLAGCGSEIADESEELPGVASDAPAAEATSMERPIKAGFLAAELCMAAFEGDVVGVRSLLEQGADVDAEHPEVGATSLYFAVGGDHLEVVQSLLAHGADVEARSSEHDTPLLLAASNSYDDIVVALLEHGADPNAADDSGLTVLHLYAQNNDRRFVPLLIEKGASVEARDKDEATALHHAAGWGHTEMVEILVEYGAEINPRDSGRKTPLYYATSHGTGYRGDSSAADLLRRHGGVE